MVTYPNQKIIHINKGEYTQNYLTVGIDEWIEASKVLKPNTFKVYLYLCSNADGFDLALSRQDVINKLGISLDSYKRAIKELTDKKYIELKQGNVYDFYTMPSMVAQKQPLNNIGSIEAPSMGAYKQPLQVHTSNHNECIEAPSMVAHKPPEINKKNNINNLSNISKDADAKKERDLNNKKRLEDLTDEELENLKYDYKSKVKYIELYKKYNLMNGILSKEIENEILEIQCKRRDNKDKYEVTSALGIDIDICKEIADYFGTTVALDGVVACFKFIAEYMYDDYTIIPDEDLHNIKDIIDVDYVIDFLMKNPQYKGLDSFKEIANKLKENGLMVNGITKREGDFENYLSNCINTDNSYMDDIWAEMGL